MARNLGKPTVLQGMPKQVRHGYYFRDNIRRADYALKIKKATNPLLNYIFSLEKIGLQLEVNKESDMAEEFILTIHIPEKELQTYSKIYDIGLDIPTFKVDENSKCCKWQNSHINIPTKNKGEFTSMERIMIIQKLLELAKFGIDPDDRGLSKLLHQHVIQDAYPLHDGPAVIPSDANDLNDRQASGKSRNLRWPGKEICCMEWTGSKPQIIMLLYLHWARFGCWYKKVPLDLVYNYFGPEIAFYFAWVEYFNLFLLPAAIVGLLVFITNLLILTLADLHMVKDVCTAHGMLLCPTCAIERHCVFKEISIYCFAAKTSYLFDNFLTVAFAVFMSFWGESLFYLLLHLKIMYRHQFFYIPKTTVFLNLWQRKQNRLKMRWGVQYVEEEGHIRHEYIDELKKRKIPRTPGGLEPFIPKCVSVSRLVVTISICFFMIVMVLLVVLGIIFLKAIIRAEAGIAHYYFIKSHGRSIAIVVGAIIQVIFINIFGRMYGRLSICLTNFENPRTQQDYDNSVLYKRYCLAFANNYAALFYLALVKGRLYHLPPSSSPVLRLIEADTCQPATCIFPLSIQLFFLMVFKKFAGNVLTFIFIQFGFVTFFVAAFPLAPLCAFLNNILEQRLDAMKLVFNYRRPLARKVSGIGAWDGVLLGMTYFSAATNALVIAFTSFFVVRSRYRWTTHFSLSGFVNSTLSQFDPNDYYLYKDLPPNPDVCYYGDKRYPPDHPNKYKFTDDYWMDTAFKLICVFIFEHVILLSNGILGFAIPDLPKNVKEQMNIDRQIVKEAKLRAANKAPSGKESDRHHHWIMA